VSSNNYRYLSRRTLALSFTKESLGCDEGRALATRYLRQKRIVMTPIEFREPPSALNLQPGRPILTQAIKNCFWGNTLEIAPQTHGEA
jgi:hypothetical protein